MVEESLNRKIVYLKHGCNMYDVSNPKSTPMAFWTQQDLYEYVVKEKLDIAEEYGEIKQDCYGRYYTTGENRTGCVFCLFGCHRVLVSIKIPQKREGKIPTYNHGLLRTTR